MHQTSTDLDRDGAARTEAPSEQEPPAARDRLCRLAPSMPCRRCRPALVCLVKKLKKKDVALDGIEQAGEGTTPSVPLARTHFRPTTRTSSFSSIPAQADMYSWVARSLLLIPRHYLAVPPDPHLSSMILNSSILARDHGHPRRARHQRSR